MHLFFLLCIRSFFYSPRSSRAAHAYVRQRWPDQRHDRAVVARSRLRRLQQLQPAVDSSGPPVSHTDSTGQLHHRRDVSGATVQLHRDDRERGRGRTDRQEPANPEERQDK